VNHARKRHQGRRYARGVDPRPSRARRRAVALLALALVAIGAGIVIAGSVGNDKPEERAQPARTTPRRAATRTAPATVSRRGWKPHPGPVPVLMYHVVEAPAPGTPLPDLYVHAGTFRAQLASLAKRGYNGITLDQLERSWTRGEPLPPKPLIVSFDDGYRSHYTVARPALRRLRWPGVLSLSVANLKSPEGLSASRVRRLIDSGWELASHTISHIDLRAANAKRLRHELRDSRRILRYVFGVPVDNFTYPAGMYNDTVIAAVKAAGYRGALTVAPGLATSESLYELKRIRVNEDMGVEGLLRELAALGA
jgi:peptidoglycan/xylan/chitin deacetylase (PgdA/CDA1 family)